MIDELAAARGVKRSDAIRAMVEDVLKLRDAGS